MRGSLVEASLLREVLFQDRSGAPPQEMNEVGLEFGLAIDPLETLGSKLHPEPPA